MNTLSRLFPACAQQSLVTNLPCCFLSLLSLIQIQATKMGTAAISKSLPIHEIGLQQGHSTTLLQNTPLKSQYDVVLLHKKH